MSGESSQERRLDATGLFCPEPVFRTKIEMERMRVGEQIIVLADDPAAEDDISRWVNRNGHEMLEMSTSGSTIKFVIKKVR